MIPRSTNRKGSCPVFVAAALLLSLFLFFEQKAAAVSDVEMTGFGIVQETDSGRWEIKASKAYYDGHGDVILQQVSARMISGDEERVRVVSDKGRYESEKLILHLEGRVVVASGFGSRFEAPRLEWNGPGSVMLARDGIRFERGGLTVMGESVRYTVDSGTATVSGSVKTTLAGRGEGR